MGGKKIVPSTDRGDAGQTRHRLPHVGIALVLRNVWVWLHFKLAKGKWNEEPRLFLELLPFCEMLLWVTQIIGRLLHANQKQGIEYKAYQRLTAYG